MIGRFELRHRSTAASAVLAPIRRPTEVIFPLSGGGMSRGARVTGFAGENSAGDYRTSRGAALPRNVGGLAFRDGVNDPVVFEKYHEICVFPTSDRWVADGGLV